MWALRRASLRLRSQGLNVRASQASCVKLTPSNCVEDEAGILESRTMKYGRFLSTSRFYHGGCASLKFGGSRRELSSQADASSTKEDDDLEGGLYEPEAHVDTNESDVDLSDDDEDIEVPDNELESSETETGPSWKKNEKTEPQLFKAIIKAPGLSVQSALEKWVAKGKELDRKEISLTLSNLRKRKMYGRAFQLLEWLEKSKKIEFVEKDYAAVLDLIAKLRGTSNAENYINKVPESFRGELLYRTLLANYASQNNVKKTEQLFNKMKDLGLPISTFACNQLLLIYKKVDKKKISDVLLLMENENAKPSFFTYRILIDAKGQSNDIAGMEQIVETMKAEGVELNHQTQAAIVRHYTSSGLKEKALAILKEIEGENMKDNLWVCPTLLRLYANLGKADEVERIWKVVESKPRIEDCLAAVEAWGRLQKVEEAEAIFEVMANKWQLSSKNYSVLLKVYANHKMLKKGKDLIKRMGDSGCKVGPLTWDALVKLYVQAGDVEKADAVLQRVTEQGRMAPMFVTYIAVMKQYAKRGDIHNTEKIFHRMRQSGYTSRLTQFQLLIEAYINAKVPAYGIRDRMKADNVFPNRTLANQLAQVDAFRKTAVSDLID